MPVRTQDKARFYADRLQTWRRNPADFINTFWKPEHRRQYVWRKQAEICQALVTDPHEVWVKSCNSSGKTDLAGKLVVWFMACYMPDCLVVTLAPTDLLLKLQLWGQVRHAFASARYNDKQVNWPGKLLPSEAFWKITDLCYAVGLSPRPKEKERVQGFHQKNILLIIDEASGVSDDIYDAIEALKASGKVFLLVQGNPIRNAGAFYKGFKTPGKGKRITISGNDAVKAGIDGLITQAFMDEQKAKYEAGENPLYPARCLGEFPSISIDGLFPMSLIEKCFNNPVTISHERPLLYGGIDWAYGGADSCVFVAFNHGKQIDYQVLPRMEAPEAAGRALVWAREHKLRYLFPDDAGGGKVCNQFLKRLISPDDDPDADIEVIPVDPAGEGDDIYYNARARIAYNAKELMQSGAVTLLPVDRAREESQFFSYWHHPRTRKILITSKDDIRLTYHCSPDYWDAINYALEGFRILQTRKDTNERAEYSQSYQEQLDPNDGSMALGVRTE